MHPMKPRDCGADGAAAREQAITRLAGRQHGVVTRAQLLAAGLGPDAVDHRLKAGRLHTLHRGVYLLGHAAAPRHAREMAAALACGRGAVVSHRSAACLWRLLPDPAQGRDVDVTVPARDPGRKPGIRIHRVRALDPRDVRTCHGVPVTTPARTLLDLAGDAPAPELERALAEAHVRRLTSRRDLVSLLARHGPRAGSAQLRRFLEPDGGAHLTRSQAEERFLALVRAAKLPMPDVNVRIGRIEVDFLWRNEGLVVEVDGFRFHSSRGAFERDRLRDAELQARGFRVMRVTWRQLTHTREATLARIARGLSV